MTDRSYSACAAGGGPAARPGTPRSPPTCPRPPSRRFDDDSAAIQALLTGQVDAIDTNTTHMININKVMPNNDFEPKLMFNEQWMGVATSPARSSRANGQLDAISKKWVGQPRPQFPASVAGVPYTVQSTRAGASRAENATLPLV